jgi:hypothetical protein
VLGTFGFVGAAIKVASIKLEQRCAPGPGMTTVHTLHSSIRYWYSGFYPVELVESKAM